MASKAQQTLRFVKFINQQLEVLKEECSTTKMATDDCINQVQREVDTWANGGQVNQATCEEISIRIQKAITFFIAKSVELSGLQSNEQLGEKKIIPVSNIHESTNKTVSKNQDAAKSYMMSRGKEVSDVATEKSCVEMEENILKLMTMKFAILEEALFSLKKTTEQVQEKQGNVDRTLKVVSTQHKNVKKKLESSNESNLNFRKQIQKTVTKIEKNFKNISTEVANLYKTVEKFDDKFNSLEEGNKSVNVSMNKQIISVRTFSNDALMSIQDLSKSVESTNQHYNEMSNKMNQLEISINLMSTEFKEKFEKMYSLNKKKIDDFIGMTCHLFAKRVTPLEELRETLIEIKNKRKPLNLKVDDLTSQVLELSEKVTEIGNSVFVSNHTREQPQPKADLSIFDGPTKAPSRVYSGARTMHTSKRSALAIDTDSSDGNQTREKPQPKADLSIFDRPTKAPSRVYSGARTMHISKRSALAIDTDNSDGNQTREKPLPKAALSIFDRPTKAPFGAYWSPITINTTKRRALAIDTDSSDSSDGNSVFVSNHTREQPQPKADLSIFDGPTKAPSRVYSGARTMNTSKRRALAIDTECSDG